MAIANGQRSSRAERRLLLRDGQLRPSDLVLLGDDDPSRYLEETATAGEPAPASIVVSPARWRSLLLDGGQSPTYAHARIGVGLSCDDHPKHDLEDACAAPFIVIPFESFVDGRGYSLARLLRTSFRFSGELVAAGEILFDQIPLLKRCGFDTFEISDCSTIEAVQEGRFSGISEVYQSPAEGNIWRKRERAENAFARPLGPDKIFIEGAS